MNKRKNGSFHASKNKPQPELDSAPAQTQGMIYAQIQEILNQKKLIFKEVVLRVRAQKGRLEK